MQNINEDQEQDTVENTNTKKTLTRRGRKQSGKTNKEESGKKVQIVQPNPHVEEEEEEENSRRRRGRNATTRTNSCGRIGIGNLLKEKCGLAH